MASDSDNCSTIEDKGPTYGPPHLIHRLRELKELRKIAYLESGRHGSVVDEEVGGRGSEAEEPVLVPLDVGVGGEEGDGGQVDDLELEEGVVEDERGVELGLLRGADVLRGEVVGHEALEDKS